jgi:hypothetical protein
VKFADESGLTIEEDRLQPLQAQSPETKKARRAVTKLPLYPLYDSFLRNITVDLDAPTDYLDNEVNGKLNEVYGVHLDKHGEGMEIHKRVYEIELSHVQYYEGGASIKLGDFTIKTDNTGSLEFSDKDMKDFPKLDKPENYLNRAPKLIKWLTRIAKARKITKENRNLLHEL